MKYFAKYLPVEGEIKEGDTWLFPSTGKPVEYYESARATKAAIDKGFPKGQLFLCSRDIQVGDQMLDVSSNNRSRTFRGIEGDTALFDEKNEHGYYGNCSLEYMRNNLFKVIGEISPNVVWVKEGDEFEEKNVKIIVNFGESQLGVYSEYWKEYIKGKPEYELLVFIACPTCKTFH